MRCAHLDSTRTSEFQTELAMPTRCEVRATMPAAPFGVAALLDSDAWCIVLMYSMRLT